MLARTCSDQDVLDFVLHHYFLSEELARARQMLEDGSTDEEAIAYLSDQGQSTLRRSQEPMPPYMFITIPGGLVIVYHPARLFPHLPIWEGHVSALARCVLTLPQAESSSKTATTARQRPGSRYERLSLFDQEPLLDEKKIEPSRRTGGRPKKLRFVEQPVRLGTQKAWWTRPGFVIKDGPLGYAIEARKTDFYQVSLVHLPSNHVLASVYLSALDETTHPRVRAWLADVLMLTDWSRGMTAILKEKTGEQKKRAWAAQLEALWKKHQNRPYAFSLFDTGEHIPS